jgi:hypothetical protein
LLIVIGIILFGGSILIGDLIRIRPSLPICLVLLSALAAFLFYKTSEDIEKDFSTVRVMTFICFISAAICLFNTSRSTAYIEKLLLGGKIKKERVEQERDYENGSVDPTEYSIEGINPTTDNIISWSFIAVIVGLPYLTYRIDKKAADKRSAEKALREARKKSYL